MDAAIFVIEAKAGLENFVEAVKARTLSAERPNINAAFLPIFIVVRDEEWLEGDGVAVCSSATAADTDFSILLFVLFEML